MPPVWQPIVRRHPVTGRQSLYISPIYNDEVEGMDANAAKGLIDELTTFAAQPCFVYRHRWEPDDVVLWDNRCTMHQVTPHDPRERQVMHRTTIVGTGRWRLDFYPGSSNQKSNISPLRSAAKIAVTRVPIISPRLHAGRSGRCL